jgi:hypothetical protein
MEDIMDSKNKRRVSVYLDRDLVERADKAQELRGYKSRNEFFAAAMEDFLSEDELQRNGDALCRKLAVAIEKAVDFEAVKISKGLFRYAVELEVIMQMLAACWEFDPAQIKKFRKEAVNNVRRTRGKVRLDELFWRKDIESL